MVKWPPKSFSQVLFSISKSPIFIFSQELTSKCHLFELLFMRLSSNHLSKSFEDFSEDAKMLQYLKKEMIYW